MSNETTDRTPEQEQNYLRHVMGQEFADALYPPVKMDRAEWLELTRAIVHVQRALTFYGEGGTDGGEKAKDAQERLTKALKAEVRL